MYTDDMTISEVLAECLRTKGITQEDAAAKVGVKQSVISRWVAGKDAPSDRYVPQIVKLTGLSKPKVLAAIHQQRMSQNNLPARVTALEADLAAIREEMRTVVALLEGHDPKAP